MDLISGEILIFCKYCTDSIFLPNDDEEFWCHFPNIFHVCHGKKTVCFLILARYKDSQYGMTINHINHIVDIDYISHSISNPVLLVIYP